MSIYTDKEFDLFADKYKELEKALVKTEDVKLEPTRKEINEVTNLVLEFVRRKKRKIYGGTALNKVIAAKNKDDAFYDETTIPDIDFYSPDPIADVYELCNIFYDHGHKIVQGKPAQHGETYKIFVNYTSAADISYVPNNIYRKMPYIEIDGIQYTHPHFITIDIYRTFTDPLLSGTFRWEKNFARFKLLQKHYPFNKAVAPLPTLTNKVTDSTQRATVTKMLNTVFQFLQNNEEVVLFGSYAYNCFLNESKIMQSGNRQKSGKYKIIDVDPLCFISMKYAEHALDLIATLKHVYPDNASDFNIVEYYPFWQFLGYSAYINYKDVPLAYIVHYGKRCIPIKRIEPALLFKDGKVATAPNPTVVPINSRNTRNTRSLEQEQQKKDQNGNFVQIASFDLSLLYTLFMTFKMKVTEDKNQYQFYNIMFSHLVELKHYYFERTKKDMLDDTLFQEFVIDCVGHTIHPKREQMLNQNKKGKSRSAYFHYDPAKQRKDRGDSMYRFANSSGNVIQKSRNFKIIKFSDNQLPIPDDDEEQEQEPDDEQGEK